MNNTTNTVTNDNAQTTRPSWLRFLIPSIVGLFLFMAPITFDDQLTIPVAVLASWLRDALAPILVDLIAYVIAAMAVLSLLFSVIKPKIIVGNAFTRALFIPTPLWLAVRICGGIAAILTLHQYGPEFIWEENTGGLVLEGLLPTLFSVFIFAGLMLPLLLNFGLLELFGTLLSKIMRPVFNLPGRSAIDCIASWLGDGSVGILLTSKQYEEKFYTQREAAVVGTTFSAVSITFSLVVIAQVKLEHLFVPFYATVCLAGVVAAIILPRIPPLSLKKDVYIDGSTPDHSHHTIPQGYNNLTWGLHLALKRANQNQTPMQVLIEGIKNAAEMVFGVLPVVMGLGTFALVLAEHTSVFSTLGQPFLPLLELLQIPEAEQASTTMVVGFADMFIPAILASSIDSEMTRFIIAAMSVTQLIYMSEVGALLLGSRIPVNILELFILFILRTLITVPVITLAAHCIF